ncbi:hypothetical protein AK812_SmicGene1588 [Symbiodinium microadriaticum]|uniref:E3 ubiquitin-protein ligase HERC2 n=1 Tax=Symbiodinium microadriaticum TaxID=2951 RepID=A0A1Q9F3Q4_SYMMI|nr:hypothetical protein AK812_SmicGene1588 [Symbiodinium microadriaticum]
MAGKRSMLPIVALVAFAIQTGDPRFPPPRRFQVLFEGPSKNSRQVFERTLWERELAMWRPLAVLCRLRPAKARSFAEVHRRELAFLASFNSGDVVYERIREVREWPSTSVDSYSHAMALLMEYRLRYVLTKLGTEHILGAVGGVQYFSLDGSPNELGHALAAIRDKRPQQVMLETCAERQVLNSRLTQEEASPETGEQGRVLSHGDAIAFIHGGLRGSDARALTVVAEEDEDSANDGEDEADKDCAGVDMDDKLLDSSGRALVGSSKIIDSSVRSGDCLSLHLSRVQIQATSGAFAAILGDGSVVTWGDAACGGDSSAVQDQLKNVQQIQASYSAFAAVLGDGSLVTWGKAEFGVDSSAVQDQLKNVQQVQASSGAFAAILGDGSVVTWGVAVCGGDSSTVQDQLKNVQQIQASNRAFAAILGDGSVVTWGEVKHGGDSSAVQDQLKNVMQVGSQVYTVDRFVRNSDERIFGTCLRRHWYAYLWCSGPEKELLAFSRYAASALSVGSEDPSRIAEECPAAVSQILGSEREQHMASEITKRVVDDATVFVICTESRLAALKELVAQGAAHADMADVAASRIWPFLLILVYAILPSYGTMFVFWRAARVYG